MPELFGPVQQITPSSTLWLLPFLPLIGCVAHLLAGARLRTSPRARIAATAFFALPLAVTLLEVARLATLPSGARHLHWHGWQMVRAGSVSLDFGLALDPLSAALALLTLAAGMLADLRAADRTSPGTLASGHLAVAATLLVLLADGFVPMTMGFGLLSLPAWLALGARPHGRSSSAAVRRAFVLGRAGDAALLAGGAILLWGLGGAWLADGVYQPDALARLVAVTSAEPRRAARGADDPAPHARPPVSTIRKQAAARLTLTALPGARVLLDGREIERSPFTGRAVEAGIHTVRVAPGGAEDEYEVANFRVDAGGNATIALLGPSLSFREIGDQLLIRGEGGASMRERLAGRRLFGVGLVEAACLAFSLAAAMKTAEALLVGRALANDQSARPLFPLVPWIAALAASYLIARLWFLFALTSVTSISVIGAGALFAALAATAASRLPARRAERLSQAARGEAR